MLSPRLLLLLILVVPTASPSVSTVSASHSRIEVVSPVPTSAVVLSIPRIAAFSSDWLFPSLLGFIFLLREKCNGISEILVVVEASALLELEHAADVLLELLDLDQVLAALVPHLQVV